MYVMDKFRVISDLHLDINHRYPFSIEDKDTFTLVAGDVSGEPVMVDYKCSGTGIVGKVVDCGKVCPFFGKNTVNAKIVYDSASNCWKYGKKPVTTADSGLEITFSGINSDGPRHGDEISLHIDSAERWLRKNVTNGLFIAGNHLVYNRMGISIEEHKRRLAEKFPLESNLTFLDNSIGVMSKEVDGILFIGSTLYTDYKLPVESNRDMKMTEQQTIEFNKRMAAPKMSGGGLNDFNFGRTEEPTYNKAWSMEGDSDLSYITPTNYERFFARTFSAIKEIVEKDENKDKDVVLLTHHCPSPKCIDCVYVDSPLNASYVSNLEDFIVSHGNIKCWVCGHVHHRANFLVGQCRIVMNPLGYCNHGEYLSSKDGTSCNWTPYTYVNTKTWEVERRSFDLEKFNKEKNRHDSMFLKWYEKYGGMFF